MKLYLVRHAYAGQRESSDPHDRYRKLSDRGYEAAQLISSSLDGITTGAIISSPSTRCVLTVEPLADALGLEIIEDERIWEDSSIDEAIELLMENVSDGAVLSSHGNIIPEMLHYLIQRGMTTKGWGCAKGSVWTLTYKGGEFTKAKYQGIDSLPH